MKLPLPNELASFLAYKGEPSGGWINAVIAQIRTELALPYLSLARIEKSFYTLLIHEITTTHIATLITGRSSWKRADISYGSHTQAQISEVYQQAITKLNARSGLELSYFDIQPTDDFRIDSQNTPEYTLVSRFFQHLHKQLMTTID